MAKDNKIFKDDADALINDRLEHTRRDRIKLQLSQAEAIAALDTRAARLRDVRSAVTKEFVETVRKLQAAKLLDEVLQLLD